MNVATLVPESATGLVSVAHVGQPVNNLAYAVLALYAEASLPDTFLTEWLQEQKKKVPTPVLLARFEVGEFTNERLEVLLDLGFDGWIIGRPSTALIEKICAKITNDIVHISGRYGRLVLQGEMFFRGKNWVKLSVREASVLRMLLEARSRPVTQIQMRVAHGYKPDSNTHTFETHVYRLKQKLKPLGMGTAIESKIRGGYWLDL